MKNILLGFLFTVTTLVSAAPNPIQEQELIYSNELLNSGFESGTYGWTASGGATTAANSTAKSAGAKGYEWDSNGASQTLISTSVSTTTKAGLRGQNGLGSCYFKAASGTATHVMQIYDVGSAAVVNSVTIPSDTTYFRKVELNFAWPATGYTYAIRIVSVAANEPSLYIDECYLGRATNLYDVNSITSWQSVTVTTAITGTGTPTAYRRRVGDSAEYQVLIPVTGAIGGTATITIPDIIDTAKVASTSFQPLGYASYQDTGTTIFPGFISYNNTTSVFLSAPRQGQGTGSTYVDRVSLSPTIPFTWANGDNISVYFKVPVVGWQSEIAIRPDQAGLTPRVSYTPVVSGLGTGSTTTMVGWEQRVGDTVEGQIDYIQNAAGSGTTNVSWTAPRTLDTAKAQSIGGVYYVGYARVYDIATLSSGVDDRTYPVYYSSGSFQIVRPASAGGAIRGQDLEAGAQLTIFFKYPVSGWTQTMPAPLLVGSVTSSSVGSEKLERMTIICSASSSVLYSSIAGVTVGNISSNRCTVTLPSGAFSSPPACVAQVDTSSTTQIRGANLTVTGNNTFTIGGMIHSGSTTSNATSDGFQIICMGPRQGSV